MIKEAYCSFEVAKLLKEKGFDESCYGRYSVRSKEFHLDTTKPCNNGSNFLYCAPTHQMAMAWLRQTHKINIVIMPVVTDDDGDGGCLYNYIIFKLAETIRQSKYLYKKYSMACDNALKYVLKNLI